MNQIVAVGSDVHKLRECMLEACDMLTACGFTKPIATLVQEDINQLIKMRYTSHCHLPGESQIRSVLTRSQ